MRARSVRPLDLCWSARVSAFASSAAADRRSCCCGAAPVYSLPSCDTASSDMSWRSAADRNITASPLTHSGALCTATATDKSGRSNASANQSPKRKRKKKSSAHCSRTCRARTSCTSCKYYPDEASPNRGAGAGDGCPTVLRMAAAVILRTLRTRHAHPGAQMRWDIAGMHTACIRGALLLIISPTLHSWEAE